MASRSHHNYSSDSDSYARRPRRSHRHSADYPPRRRHQRTTSAPEAQSSTAANVGKLALGVVFVQLVSTCLSTWMRKKEDEAEREYQHLRKRDFEKAKAKRRKEEERWEREQEERERVEEEGRWEREVIITEGKRIAYAPDSEEDEGREEMRRIEPPPANGRSERAKSRGAPRSEKARSVDGRGRRYEERGGRSRSRPAVNVS